MPYNGSGVYILPTGQPVVTGTVIQSATHNTLAGDLASTLNNVVTRDGQGGVTGPFKLTSGTSSIPGLSFNAESSTGLFWPSTGILAFTSQGVETMRLKTNGAVLIGTTTDDGVNRLQVIGGIGAQFLSASGAASFGGTLTASAAATVGTTLSVGSTLSVGGSASITGVTTSSSEVRAPNFVLNAQTATDAGTFGFYNGNGPGMVVWGNSSAGAGRFDINTGGTQRMTINGTGSVASFSTAGSKLLVGTGSGGTGNLYVYQAGAVSVAAEVSSAASSIAYGSNNSGGANPWGAAAGSSFLHATGSVPLSFGTASVERMRIDASGNVGIGASPSGLAGIGPNLQLKGTSSSLAGHIAVTSSDAGTGVGLYSGLTSSDTAAITYQTGLRFGKTSGLGVSGFAEVGRFDSSGNFGVGTTPFARLHVLGTGELARFQTTSARGAGNGYMQFADAGGLKAYFGYGGADDTFTVMNYLTGAALAFGTANSERMRIDASGNVGIGVTPNGTYKLQTPGGMAAANYSIGTQLSSDAGTFGWYNGNGPSIIMYGTTASGAGNILFTAASGEKMRMDATGKFGIGTAPTSPIDVLGASVGAAGTWQQIGQFRDNAGAGKGVGLGIDTASQTGIVVALTNSAPSNLAIWTYGAGGWAERARFDNNGWFGLGGAPNAAYLDVYGANSSYPITQAFARFTNSSSTGQSAVDFMINGTLRGRMRVDYSGAMSMVTNGSGFYVFTGGDSGTGALKLSLTASSAQFANQVIGNGGSKGFGQITTQTSTTTPTGGSAGDFVFMY